MFLLKQISRGLLTTIYLNKHIHSVWKCMKQISVTMGRCVRQNVGGGIWLTKDSALDNLTSTYLLISGQILVWDSL